MFLMFGLLLMSAESSYGMVTSCNVTQNMSCYGALGGTVYLQLMNDATGSELTFIKDPTDGLYLDTRVVQLIIGGGSYGTTRGSLVAVVLVLAVVVGAYCIRKRRNPPQASDAVESPELECDDITILKKREKQREVPEEVVYGQIVVLEGARPNTERDRPEGQEETLYAGIQLGQ
ncbi:uncharacterized protein LOC109910262 isoform X2 [Oncorhynchus kisutch]|uniref:uncharacterized protein LOC109910262 isoform X2 n=1 Tax=Oncorhynchus kisutch TaxID=8019 RepID=UPI0009A04A45|nr:uncharacterized protein LOC109910262 isoform X2 [Oncorhynchus kisutch]